MKDVPLPLRQRQPTAVPARLAALAIDAERAELNGDFEPGRTLAQSRNARGFLAPAHGPVKDFIHAGGEELLDTIVVEVAQPRGKRNSGQPPTQLGDRPSAPVVEHHRVELSRAGGELGLSQGGRRLHCMADDAESLGELTGGGVVGNDEKKQMHLG